MSGEQPQGNNAICGHSGKLSFPELRGPQSVIHKHRTWKHGHLNKPSFAKLRGPRSALEKQSPQKNVTFIDKLGSPKRNEPLVYAQKHVLFDEKVEEALFFPFDGSLSVQQGLTKRIVPIIDEEEAQRRKRKMLQEAGKISKYFDK